MLDRECRKDLGSLVAWRIGISTRLGALSISLRPRDRELAWLPFLGYLPPRRWWSWWYITWHPSKRKRGWLIQRHPEWWDFRK